MQIILNGKQHPLDDTATIGHLLSTLDLTGRRVAVEVNGEIAPRSGHAEYHLKANDRVEIIHAVGGG